MKKFVTYQGKSYHEMSGVCVRWEYAGIEGIDRDYMLRNVDGQLILIVTENSYYNGKFSKRMYFVQDDQVLNLFDNLNKVSTWKLPFVPENMPYRTLEKNY